MANQGTLITMAFSLFLKMSLFYGRNIRLIEHISAHCARRARRGVAGSAAPDQYGDGSG